MVICAFEGCDNAFEPNIARKQKYCSSQCSVRANNKKNIERNRKKKALLGHPKRKCATIGCPTILRKANDGKYCDACELRPTKKIQEDFRRMVMNG